MKLNIMSQLHEDFFGLDIVPTQFFKIGSWTAGTISAILSFIGRYVMCWHTKLLHTNNQSFINHVWAIEGITIVPRCRFKRDPSILHMLIHSPELSLHQLTCFIIVL